MDDEIPGLLFVTMLLFDWPSAPFSHNPSPQMLVLSTALFSMFLGVAIRGVIRLGSAFSTLWHRLADPPPPLP